MRRSPALVAAVTALSFAIAGCGDGNGPDTSHVGVYDMVSVDGDPLPVTVVDEPGYTLEVHDGSMTLNANNSFVESLTLVETNDGVAAPGETIACTGRYTRRGNTITLTTPESDSCSGETAIGTLSGNTLTVDYSGTTVVFSR